MRDFVLRHARPSDAADIARMSRAFRLALNEPADHFSEAAILRDGFGEKPEFEVILAEYAGRVVGYTLFVNAYEPTYAERGLYMADLYVAPEMRRHRIGRALVAAVVNESRRRERSFVWWVRLATNTRAEHFYRSLGGVAVATVAHAATHFDIFGALADEALPIHGDSVLDHEIP